MMYKVVVSLEFPAFVEVASLVVYHPVGCLRQALLAVA